MYYVRVLTGNYTRGNQSLIVPPPRDPQNPTDLYDTVTDDDKNPSLFVVFYDNQAYPEYLITFRQWYFRAPSCICCKTDFSSFCLTLSLRAQGLSLPWTCFLSCSSMVEMNPLESQSNWKFTSSGNSWRCAISDVTVTPSRTFRKPRNSRRQILAVSSLCCL